MSWSSLDSSLLNLRSLRQSNVNDVRANKSQSVGLDSDPIILNLVDDGVESSANGWARWRWLKNSLTREFSELMGAERLH